MKKIAILTLLATVLLFTSCDNFFSNSWGKNRSYDPDKIKINAANVDEWIKATIGNPSLSKAVYIAIQRELDRQPPLPAKERAILLKAGLRLAADSSGLGESILTVGAGTLKDIDFDNLDEDTIKDLLNDLLDDFNTKGGSDAADAIGKMAGGFIDTSGAFPKFDDDIADIFDAGEVAEAILVLILGELGEDGAGDWSDLEQLNIGLEIGDDGHVVIAPGADPSDNAIALAAYLNLIKDDTTSKYDENSLTSAIKDAFFKGENP